jgi:hypothetical protein
VTGLNQHGTLTLENDSAGVTLNGSQLNGLAYVENNTATAPAVITVSGNTVTGSLYCTGNTPPPTDSGTVNTVSGTVHRYHGTLTPALAARARNRLT